MSDRIVDVAIGDRAAKLKVLEIKQWRYPDRSPTFPQAQQYHQAMLLRLRDSL